ncbi:MAG: thioredoxin family protein [Chloroflexi bacterium]|nr:MAG: thioredoxin family protein [Chloroflexota bacterium]
MAAVPSNMLPLGTVAPEFELLETASGKLLRLMSLKSNVATVIMFICNHCPYVKHVNKGLVDLAFTYQKQGVAFVAISSNDIEAYPADSPERMKDVAVEQGYPFPYLYDEDQSVAKAYQAACTPDFYIFDADMKLVYRGQLDSSRPRNDIPVTGEDVRAALDALLAGQPISKEQRPSLGCNIKWKES